MNHFLFYSDAYVGNGLGDWMHEPEIPNKKRYYLITVCLAPLSTS